MMGVCRICGADISCRRDAAEAEGGLVHVDCLPGWSMDPCAGPAGELVPATDEDWDELVRDVDDETRAPRVGRLGDE